MADLFKEKQFPILGKLYECVFDYSHVKRGQYVIFVFEGYMTRGMHQKRIQPRLGERGSYDALDIYQTKLGWSFDYLLEDSLKFAFFENDDMSHRRGLWLNFVKSFKLIEL